MEKEFITKALFWEAQGSHPKFENMHIRYDGNCLLVNVRAAMFGKALYRAITIGHPKIRPPKVLGTLLSGDTVNDMPNIPKGTRVVIHPHAFDLDGNKISITPGAISQMVKIEGALPQGVFTIPQGVSYTNAVYCELIACAMESIKKIKHSNEIIIVGCGLMAMIQIQIARNAGFDKIVCIYNHQNRIDLIKNSGGIPIEYSDDAEKLKQRLRTVINGKNLAVIDSAGTLESAKLLLALAREHSELVFFAGYPIGSSILLDLNKIHYNNVNMMGSYHFDHAYFSEALNLLKNNLIDVDPLITGRINWRNIDCMLQKFKSEENISNVIIFD